MAIPYYVQETWQHLKCYNALNKLNGRCRNFLDKKYKNYGGRGITICKRWTPLSETSYNNFIQDMGLPPTKDHSVDRIDNDGNYTKDNCRWATYEEQANNRRPRAITEDIVYRKSKGTWVIYKRLGSEQKILLHIPSEFLAERFAKLQAEKLNIPYRKL